MDEYSTDIPGGRQRATAGARRQPMVHRGTALMQGRPSHDPPGPPWAKVRAIRRGAAMNTAAPCAARGGRTFPALPSKVGT